MLTDTNKFIGTILIDPKSFDTHATNFFTEKESDILTDLLGYELKTALEAGLLVDPIPEKYSKLTDGTTYTVSDVIYKVAGIKEMLPYLQYFYFTRDQKGFSTSLGEFESTVENAQRNDNTERQKSTTAYNKGLRYYYELVDYIVYVRSQEGNDYYKGFCYKPLRRTNILGL
jgi:hypothetical protein